MTIQAAVTPEALREAASRCVSFVAAAWRTVTARQIAAVSLLGFVWSASEIGARLLGSPSRLPSWGPVVNGVLGMQFNALAIMLAVRVADRASPPPLRRWWPYVLAVVAGAIVGSSLYWGVSQRIFGIVTIPQLRGMPDGYDTFAFRQVVHGLMVCGLATYVYVCHRFAAHRLAVLRAVQLERVATEKQVLESRLAVMQARVEPQFLLDTVARVERLYDLDAEAADRVLKDLTTYLRAAIPQTNDPASTVGREIQLTNAFLNIVGLQSKDRLVRSVDGPTIEDGARMPPMILLPLINHALAHRVARARGDEWFGVEVAVSDDRLTLTLRDRGAGFTPEGSNTAEIGNLRERLAALYGDGARLTLKETRAGTEAVLEMPYEVIQDNVRA